MIVSHKHKFIFLKTKKTAGTSIELALSKFCGSDDIITPLLEEEEMRIRGSYPEAQNYMIPWHQYNFNNWKKFFLEGKRANFFNHMRGERVKQLIGERIWNSYFKFCFERNPWDKVISGYYYGYRDSEDDSKPTLSEYIQKGNLKYSSSHYIYTSKGKVIVDKVFLYENLDESLREISNYLNLPEPLELPKAKAGLRKDRRHYREILSESERDVIAQSYRREIKLFDYEY